MEGWREFELVAVVLLQGPPEGSYKVTVLFPSAALAAVLRQSVLYLFCFRRLRGAVVSFASSLSRV